MQLQNKDYMKRQLLRLFLLALMALPLPQVVAQSEMPLSAFATTGGTVVSQAGAALSYTIGQWSYRRFGNTDVVEEGVQQVFCIATFDTLDTAFCLSNASDALGLLPAGTAMPQGIDLSTPGRYEFVIRGLSEGGCDSIVWVMLTIYPEFSDTVSAQGAGCYSWHSRNYEASGIYPDTLVSVQGCDSVVWLHLSLLDTNVPMPRIYSYSDKVLMVDNSQTDYYYYRWYREDSLVLEGADAASYHKEDGSSLDGCFYLEVSASADTSLNFWVRSNTLCFGSEGIDEVVKDDLIVSLAPNPVSRESVFRVALSLAETQLQGARIVVYDVQGRKVLERAAMSQTSIVANFPAGVYSVHLLLGNGRHAARKLVVR